MGDSSEHTRTTDFWRRPHTEELVDVHVYLVPSEKWIEQRKLAKRDVIDQAVSSGFVRVLPSTTLLELRSEISAQLGSENVPEAFVFLRSVGRNFTQVRCKQELELKIKSFLPPYAEEPEVYLKEGDYTAVRSASLSVLSRNTLFNNSDSPTEYPTSSESLSESRGGNIISTVNQKPRTLSLDRIEKRNAMSSVKSTPTQLNLQRLRQRNTRPPTPRVKERSFGKSSSKYRSTSINSMKLNESIRESPTELVEERASKNETLDVEKESERIVNSPPPRPPSETSKANKDVSITVPTPTPDLVKRLKSSIEELRAERRLRELKRDALLQKVRDLQKRKASSKDRAQEKLNIEFYPAREEWRKRYMEVKKSTPRLEDHCGKLRQELEKLVKDMLVSVKTDADSKPHKPSKKTSYKIMIMRLLQEVEDLRRRLQSVTIRLNAETKLRSQAEFEVKRLREDLLHKKTQVTLTRKQTSFPPAEQFFISAV